MREMTACTIAILLTCACVQPSYRTVPPPAPGPMPAGFAIGTWHSNFGDVRIDQDPSRGGLALGAIVGTWVYWDPTTAREVRGHFQGTVKGTLLRLVWSEADPDPTSDSSGDGFLEFTPDGGAYSGRWWNRSRSKTGRWDGWRPRRAPIPSSTPPTPTSVQAPGSGI